MKTFNSEVGDLLDGAVSVTVFADSVPKEAGLPAVSYSNIGYRATTPNGRTVNRKQMPIMSSWRVIVIGARLSDINPILDELGAIHNTENEDFQDITLVMNNNEAKQPDSPVRRAIIDLNVTERIT